MDAALKAKFLLRLLALSDKKINRKSRDLPSLEVYLRMGDKQYNASVANRLQVLKEN
jgi:F-type H+-transporting ATPase subunit delta